MGLSSEGSSESRAVVDFGPVRAPTPIGVGLECVRPEIDFVAVEQAVGIRIDQVGIGPDRDLVEVGDPVAVEVRRRIGRVGRIEAPGDLDAVEQAVVVGVRIERIGAMDQLLGIGETIRVGIGLRAEGVGGPPPSVDTNEAGGRAKSGTGSTSGVE